MNCSYKYKWCALFDYVPDLNCVPIVFQPPTLLLQTTQDWLQILSRIKDVRYVLKQCYCTEFADRKTLINVLKYGLTVCNNFLKAHDLYAPPAGVSDSDVLASCHRSFYSYTPAALQESTELQYVVLMKYLLCMKLLRIRLYNAVLMATNRGLAEYNPVEFQHYGTQSIRSLCMEWG